MKNYTDRSLTKGRIMSSTKYCQEPQERPVYEKKDHQLKQPNLNMN